MEQVAYYMFSEDDPLQHDGHCYTTKQEEYES